MSIGPGRHDGRGGAGAEVLEYGKAGQLPETAVLLDLVRREEKDGKTKGARFCRYHNRAFLRALLLSLLRASLEGAGRRLTRRIPLHGTSVS